MRLGQGAKQINVGMRGQKPVGRGRIRQRRNLRIIEKLYGGRVQWGNLDNRPFDSEEARRIAGSGREMTRCSSHTATPTRLVPGSIPTMRPPAGTPEMSVRSSGLEVSFCCTRDYVVG